MINNYDVELMLAYKRTKDIDAVGMAFGLTPSEQRELQDLIDLEEMEECKQYERNKLLVKVKLPQEAAKVVSGCIVIKGTGCTYPIQFEDDGSLNMYKIDDSIIAVIHALPCDKTGNIPGIRANQIVWIEEKNKYE
jgi:hypothetical protein